MLFSASSCSLTRGRMSDFSSMRPVIWNRFVNIFLLWWLSISFQVSAENSSLLPYFYLHALIYLRSYISAFCEVVERWTLHDGQNSRTYSFNLYLLRYVPVVETVGWEESSRSGISADQVDFLLGYIEERVKILFRAFPVINADINSNSHGLHGLQGYCYRAWATGIPEYAAPAWTWEPAVPV